MEHLIEVLSIPPVQRALLAGIFSGPLLGVLGIFVVLRKMAFFSDGIAHTALAGVAIALLVGHQPLVWAVGVGVAFALAIYYFERKTDIAPDSLIGILFTSSLALGVVLMNFKKGYQPDLISFLFGNILTIQSTEIWIIVPLAVVILGFVLLNYKKYLFLCLNDELARLAAIPTEIYRMLLYVLLAVSSILAIKMFGIILVSSLLIIPVSFSKLFAHSAKSLLALTVIFVELIVIGGSILSLVLNLPTGAVIVLTGTVLFITAMSIRKLLSA